MEDANGAVATDSDSDRHARCVMTNYRNCQHCGCALVDHNLIDMITCVYSGETVDGRPFNRNDAAKVVMKAAERLSR